MEPRMDGKVVLITGGNTGIGKQTAIDLARRGAQVVITSRNPEKGQAALAEIRRASGRDDAACLHLDLASLASVRALAAEFLAHYPRLDVLVLNAGLMLSDRTETADGFETTFGVNHLGHFALTGLLLARLKQSGPARIVVLASNAHRGAKGGLDFEDLQNSRRYDQWQAYARSKLANLLFTLELAERLAGSGVTVNAVHPGVVATEWGNAEDVRGLFGLALRLSRWAMLTPAQGARTSVYVASAPELAGVSGKYFASSREKQPRRAALHRESARRLWEISEQLTGVRY
jgi:NAD(P)-dependent dehydrogenase (short-subunit alcohol dehydrogenase family)